ncbi:MAG: hypothetical protein RL189_654 [Pseudomonadota bacterium]
MGCVLGSEVKNLMRKQIDEKLKYFSAATSSPPPKSGWLKAIREALIMTAEQAASRVKTKRQVWLKIEEGEANGTVSLNTLRKYAAALNCRVVYAIVPHEESLEVILKKRAREVALQIINRTQHTMALEEQDISDAERERQIEEIAHQLMLNLSPRLWENIHEL